MDIAYPVAEMPAANQKVSTTVSQITAGGPATNAAVTFAFLGGKTTLISAVGQHALSAVIRQDLQRHNICLHDIAGRQTGPPPVSSILVLPNGDRSVVSANANAFPDLNAELDREWFGQARFVLVDGHYPALCHAAATHARAAGLDVILDAGSWKQGTPALLSHTTIALCSNDFRPPGCATTDEVFDFLTRSGVQRIAITRGADSILYVDHGASGEIPVERIKPLDTTAAGDVFHGAFCYRFSMCSEFADALRFAAKAATFSCRHIGTRSWMDAFPTQSSYKFYFP